MFKFGIIGAGKIAHNFCDAVRRVDNAAVAAVSSKSIEKAGDFAAKENIKDYFGSYQEMLAACDLDAVYIATTHNFHYENALLCLNYGKPVLIEKAMALTKKQAEEIFELAKSKNLFVMEAMWPRFLPHINKARDWLACGMIGDPVLASCSLGFKAEQNPENRYFNPELAGGVMYDVGVYLIEVMAYIINQQVRSVKSIITRAETGVDLTDNISIKFDTCIANLQTTFAANIRSGMFIYGTDGYIEIPVFIGGNECFLYKDGKLAEHFKEEYENGYVFEVEETIRCVKEGLCESPVVSHAATLMCCEIFDSVLIEPNSKNTN